MNQQRSEPQLILTQFEEKTDRNGQMYLTGQIGMVWVNIFPSKNNPSKWNVFLKQKERRERNDFNQQRNDDDFGF